MVDFENKFKQYFTSFLRLLFHSEIGGEIDKSGIKNILVIRQHDQLGDMILAVPVLRTLREEFPKSRISLIASPVNYLIMRYHPNVDDVINYDKANLRRSLSVFLKFIRNLRSQQFDIVIVPSTISLSMTSNLLARFCGAKVRIGPGSLNKVENETAFCFTHPVDLDWTETPKKHHSARNLDVLQPLRINSEELQGSIGLTNVEQKQAKDFLHTIRKSSKIFVGFHPGAGHPENRWPAEKFISIAGRLARDYDAGIVVTSGPMDRESIEIVKRNMRCEYHLVENKSIREVAAIIDSLDLFIANDTGIMHVAGATKTNLLSLFGPSDPLLWAPVGQKNRYITSKDKKIESLSEEDVMNMITIILSQMRYTYKKT